MGETVRFGVSLDSDLLEKFDALCERQGCPSRSEALRDIIRDALVQDSLHSETADAAGVLSLIYDHHVRDLSRKLTERQHDAHGLIVTTLHVHLDHHNCLEILVLKGKAGELRELGGSASLYPRRHARDFFDHHHRCGFAVVGYIGGRGGHLSEEGLPSPSPAPPSPLPEDFRLVGRLCVGSPVGCGAVGVWIRYRWGCPDKKEPLHDAGMTFFCYQAVG